MRLQSVVAVVMLAAVACSSPDRARRMSPTAPSSSTQSLVTMNDIGGISGPMDVRFPDRSETYAFRQNLETKYRDGLRRGVTLTYVNLEGSVVWTQEYLRYRVNGCDHETAIARVFAQIDGAPAGGICAENRDFVVVFPPRNDTLDFRRRLEEKYRQLGHPQQSTFVDIEGDVIWTQEYLGYRVNECDHVTAMQKVNTQIDGGPVPPNCVPECRYRMAPGNRDLNGSQQSSFVDIIGEPGGCPWTASSDASWLTFSSDLTTGTNSMTIPYTVAQNVSGGPRTGRIRMSWGSGSGTSHTVYQDGSAVITSFTMTDPFRSGSAPTTECHFRSAATPCTFTAISNLVGAGVYTYAWTASYDYGGATKTVTVTNNSNIFTITDACGASDASSSGNRGFLNVSLTVTDSLGNSQTVRSGDGTQPALSVLKYTC